MEIREIICSYFARIDGFSLDQATSDIKAWAKGLVSEGDIEKVMLGISQRKGEEQIKEVEKVGLWSADLVTVTLKEFATAIKQEIDRRIDEKSV